LTVPVSSKKVESMNTLLSELIDILNREIELHKELLSCIQQDRCLLVDLRVDDIFENIKKKETLSVKIKMLEESRVSLVEQLSPHYGISQQPPTLSDLASAAEEPHRSALNNSRSTLLALLNSIQEINQGNSLIVKDSLFYCNRSLDFLNHSFSANPTYLNSGRIKDAARFGSLLKREI